MSNLFQYLFTLVPGSPFRYYIPLLILAITLIVGGVLLRQTIKRKRDDRIFRKLFLNTPDHFYWISIFILLNLFGRNQRFPLLGARFILFITLIWLLYTLYKTWKKYKVEYPKTLALLHDKKDKPIYTTHKKKKR